MKCLLISALILSSILCVPIDQDSFLQLMTNKKVEHLTETKTGQFIIGLVQLHTELEGPLEDLSATIQALVDELTAELTELDAEYARKQAEHERTVFMFEQQINQAQLDVTWSQDKIDNVIIPNRNQLVAKIQQLNSNIQANRQALQRETQTRQNDHQQYLDRVNEHQMALNAIDEALQLTGGLLNGNVAFAEGRSMVRSIRLVESRLDKHAEYSAMIQALLELSQNFSDQSQVKQIRDMLNDLRKNIVDSLNTENADEKQNQAAYEERVSQLNKEYAEFQRQVNDATYYLTAYNNKLKSENQYLNERKSELARFQEFLDSENASFAEITNLYQELRTQLVSELTTATQARDFLGSAEFSTYLRARMNNQPLQ